MSTSLTLANNPLAPELTVSDWLNTNQPLSISELRGKVIVLHAFQMLCPGCVLHGIPQAAAIHELYDSSEVQVIGLHTVFEHHNVMNKNALEAFIHEYQLRFPVAIDQAPSTGAIPVTMKEYELQGTPSLILIDQQGHIKLKHFGRLSDMQVGNYIGQLLSSGRINENVKAENDKSSINEQCNETGCPV